MNKNIDFDFCIIPNPFSNKGRNMIFITKTGEKFLNKELTDNKHYSDIKEILENFGYTETDFLQFESSNNNDIKNSTILEMKEFLEEFGLSYSRELEVNIVRDLNVLKIKTDIASQNNFIYENYEEDSVCINENTKNELIKSKNEMFKFKHKEPCLGEKVCLNFYLFLEFGFNQHGVHVIQFGGDFKDDYDYDYRNYIKIIESEFERINDPNSPNSIVLKSLKNQNDFLKEIGVFYNGFFKYQRRIEKKGAMILKETKYPYKLIDVKKYIKPEQPIVIETNKIGYDELIKLSEKIKTESIKEGEKIIYTAEIERKAKELNIFLSNKMSVLSQKEEFEEAYEIKKEIESIIEKIDFIKNLDKSEITTDEYFDLFSIS